MGNLSLMLLQVSAGVFFAISGYHKLANRERHATLVATLKQDRVPLVRINEWFVPTVELTAGAALVLAQGLLAAIAAALLLGVCTVATCVDGLKRVRDWKPIDIADWLDDLLYLPEVLLAVMLIVVIIEHI
jgi:uncharacterized membrane protein YphA (DoxX/SURF4 family)